MRPRDSAFAGSSYNKMWAGLNGFDPGKLSAWRRKDWHGLHQSSLLVISRYTRVPVTLIEHGHTGAQNNKKSLIPGNLPHVSS